MIKDRVQIGVIGLGIMGDLYVKIYSQHPLAEVVAVKLLPYGMLGLIIAALFAAGEIPSLFSAPAGRNSMTGHIGTIFVSLGAVMIATVWFRRPSAPKLATESNGIGRSGS
ncbi:MAG: hypothetical protein ACRD5R_16750 [Candidatus Acidiferrales bacterium]